MRQTRWSVLALVSLAAPVISAGEPVRQDSTAIEAARIMDATGIRAGLVVLVGCRDGRLAAAFGAREHFVVHALPHDHEAVRETRSAIHARGLYGRVAVDRCPRNTLPYIDNLVNLLIAENPGAISHEEVTRVLVPNGVAYLRKDGQWKQFVKPRPHDIDEWTHYLHDPSNNAVAKDAVVGPCRRLQWSCGPRWTRSHEKMSGLSAMVSAGGRIFSIIDEGPLASIQLPPTWRLVARDAFNGALLWKRAIPSWYPHLWPLKSGPAKLPRRLVAVGSRVYVTLGVEAPISILAAEDGTVLQTVAGSRGTEEIIVSKGVLFANIIEDLKTPIFRPKDPFVWNEAARARRLGKWARGEGNQSIAAFQAETGTLLWRKPHAVAPLSLAADQQWVYFSDGQRIFCLDRKNGEQRWESEPLAEASEYTSQNAPTLVVYKDVILYSPLTSSVVALAAPTGTVLWKASHPRAGHHSPGDLLVIDDMVWSGGAGGGPFVGKNVRTGHVNARFTPPAFTWFHPRCHRSKATERYILASRTGIEYADVHARDVTVQLWVRGACVYGIMPCNGLLYTPPHPCACFLESKTTDFNALAPARSAAYPPIPADQRLERGPAYGSAGEEAPPGPEDHDWPTYRSDPERSGCTPSTLSPDLTRAWRADIGGRLSSMTAARGRIFCASIDRHTLYALDAASGQKLWEFTGGARVDSPPTAYRNTVIFGGRDGAVYCVRARDGELVWRFRAAPAEQLLMCYEQLESVWPIHGSVLVLNDCVYFVAGRSMFLDGGLRFYRLDAGTGRLLSVTVMDEKDPESGRHLQNLQAGWCGLTMPVALPDILSSDGKRIYMRSQPFNLNGKRLRIAPDLDAAHQARDGTHLFSPVGFLDDTWMHRTYWLLGVTVTYGWRMWFEGGRFAPAGRILSFNDTAVYGFGRTPEHYAQSPILEYHLYGADRSPEKGGPDRVKSTEKDIASKGRDRREQDEGDKANWKTRKEYSARQLTAVRYHWRDADPSLLVRAMVLTEKVLFVAGPPNLVNEEAVWNNPGRAALEENLENQKRAWRGDFGARLQAINTADGTRLAEYKLDALPVFDGLICAGHRLFLAHTDGTIVCYEEK
jgi:outer membrane protein assembly factor BamB